ncbi:ATP-binding protein [Streptomyces sp. NPDC059743]|uniref:ATP-binding protein n=1 Tax=Streptomyces sp. NPDC059743 TaxID=3346928 RepID=UPI003651A132
MSLSRQRRFPRARTSVGSARDFALDTLTEWGVSDRHDDIRLCVSELATNALLHGVPPGREFRVRLTVEGLLVRVEVSDSGGGCPVVLNPEADQCTGRGLQLANELADDFGVTEHVVGKTVWLAFKTGSAPVWLRVRP